MKRCADGCKYCNQRWGKNWCDFYGKEIENKGWFCSDFKQENLWDKFLKWLGM